jgi:hypothetical protein
MSALLFLPIENNAYESKGDPDIDPYYIYSIGHYTKDIGFIVYHLNNKMTMIGLKCTPTAKESQFNSFKKKINIVFYNINDSKSIGNKLSELNIVSLFLPKYYEQSSSSIIQQSNTLLGELKDNYGIQHIFSPKMYQHLIDKRFIKRQYEIERIRKACDITSEGILHMWKERRRNPQKYNSTLKMLPLAKDFIKSKYKLGKLCIYSHFYTR